MCRPLLFLIDAGSRDDDLHAVEKCCACECIKSDAVGPLPPQRACCARMVHMLPPSSRPSHRHLTFLPRANAIGTCSDNWGLVRCLTLSPSTNFYLMWSPPFTRLVIKNEISRRSHAWQRSSPTLVCPVKAPCVHSTRLRVCRKHMCAWCRLTRGLFSMYTRSVLNGHTGGCRQFCFPKKKITHVELSRAPEVHQK